MPYAKVFIEAVIASPAREVADRKNVETDRSKPARWVDNGKKYEYLYNHIGADLISGKLTSKDGTLEQGKTYLVPLRVEFKDPNIRLDEGVALMPAKAPK